MRKDIKKSEIFSDGIDDCYKDTFFLLYLKVYYKKLDIMTGVIKNLKETSFEYTQKFFSIFFLAFLRDSRQSKKGRQAVRGKMYFFIKFIRLSTTGCHNLIHIHRHLLDSKHYYSHCCNHHNTKNRKGMHHNSVEKEEEEEIDMSCIGLIKIS